MKLKMTLMVGVLVGIILVISGCQFKSEEKKPDYNLVMIVSDTLRADVLSCYGGEADTPNICGLAKRGVLFENNYATAPATRASSFSIFTGNYSGVYVNTDAIVDNYWKGLAAIARMEEGTVIKKGEMTPRELRENTRRLFYNINDEEKLLAEALREKGYEAKYNTENLLIEELNKLQGFEKLNKYEDLSEDEIILLEEVVGIKNPSQGYDSNRGYERLYSFLDYLLKPKSGNFFALKWILDPHSPYFPPSRFLEKIEVDPSKLPRELKFYSSEFGMAGQGAIYRHFIKTTDYENYYIKQLYLKEVESVDERVGYILKALEYNNLLDNTIIVFISDHGEMFKDHENIYSQSTYLHGSSSYNEQIRVPLIISGPGIIEGRRVKDSVSLVDLMPTLVDLFEVNALVGAQGQSYKSLLIDEEAVITPRAQFVEVSLRYNFNTIIENNHKLIVYFDADPELYNLSEDPKELNNIAADNPDLVKQMNKKILQFKRENEIKKLQNLELVE